MEAPVALVEIVCVLLVVVALAVPRANVRALLRLLGFLFRAEVTRGRRRRARRGRSRRQP